MGIVHGKYCCDFGDEPFTDGSGPIMPPSEPLAPLPPNPDELYSKYFTLRDLTVTSLPHPNLPLDPIAQDNLKLLGTLLDTIKDNIGSFTIASAYRSPENQAELQAGAQGAVSASMAIKKSYHSLGLAADITPTNGMSPTQFAQAIYTNELTNIQVGQIVDKSEAGQGSLHISIRTPKFPEATPMDAHYVRLTKEDQFLAFKFNASSLTYG